MTLVTVLYFAGLRDAAGVSSEVVETDSTDLRALYTELQARHGFALTVDRLRVAINGGFVSWDDPVRSGHEVALIPPVSGG